MIAQAQDLGFGGVPWAAIAPLIYLGAGLLVAGLLVLLLLDRFRFRRNDCGGEAPGLSTSSRPAGVASSGPPAVLFSPRAHELGGGDA